MDELAGTEAKTTAGEVLKKVLLCSLVAIFVLVLASTQTFVGNGEIERDTALPSYFAMKQDIPVATLALVLMVAWRLLLDRRQSVRPLDIRVSRGQAVIALAGLALGIWLLRVLVLHDYNLSRDEQMVTFDAAIFAGGHLFQPIPAFWRDYYDALNVNFILPIGDREAWVSGYLPGNAALRALVGLILPASMTGPLLVLAGGLALLNIAARLWPESPATRAIVLILYATSSQVILTGTTTFAMTAHLAANLIWLALFLQRRPLAHAGAIMVGFIATGLHQPLFHPMFVAPFLLLLLRERAWKELSAYVVCYLAIGLFWIGWQPWLSTQGLQPVPADYRGDGTNFIERFRNTAVPLSVSAVWVMAENLLRFAVWQNLALVPLMAVPLLGRQRFQPLVMALWLGMALVIAFMALVLPWQGNGWGYRYLHGFIGSAALLAGFGWRWLEERGAAPGRAFAVLSAVSLAVVLPVHVWMAEGQIGAYAEAAQRLRTIDADIVIVDDGVAFAQDLVFNRADLSNRPVQLLHQYVEPADLAGLCEGRTLAFADGPLLGSVNRFFRVPVPTGPGPRQAMLKTAAIAAGCRVVPARPVA